MSANCNMYSVNDTELVYCVPEQYRQNMVTIIPRSVATNLGILMIAFFFGLVSLMLFFIIIFLFFGVADGLAIFFLSFFKIDVFLLYSCFNSPASQTPLLT